MATAAAALTARARRQIQHHFFSADAVRPDRALPFEPANGFEQRQFDRMRERNIIREASPGKFWLDVVAYDIDLRRRHRIVKTILLTVIAVMMLVVLAQTYWLK
jgi:hypothetical protein